VQTLSIDWLERRTRSDAEFVDLTSRLSEYGPLRPMCRYCVGADAEMSHCWALCRLPDEPHEPPSDPHAWLAPGLIKWRSRRSTRRLISASAPTNHQL